MQDIPKSYLLISVMGGLIALSIMGIDSWTHATLGLIVGYLLKDGMNEVKNAPLQSINK